MKTYARYENLLKLNENLKLIAICLLSLDENLKLIANLWICLITKHLRSTISIVTDLRYCKSDE